VNEKKPVPVECSIVLKGDRRLAEDLILEVRAIAEQFGLEPTSIQVTRQRSLRAKATPRAKAKQATIRRKP
jgi:hypothetical protein